MNDPSTLAAKEHDERDGPPPDPDPTPQPTPAPGPDLPVHEPHNEPIRTLLETAATCRPVEEVTALVSLLKRTGADTDTGHDALRAAAVARPVHDVRRIVALLAGQPQEEAEADITLRAAAVGRSIEDVALLASILGPDRAPEGVTAGTPEGGPGEAPQGVPDGTPDGIPGGTPGGAPDGAPDGGPGGAPAAVRPARPATAPAPPPLRRPVPAAPAPAPARAPASAAPRDRGALRHRLRWPTAAALLLCGVLHLPQDPAALAVPGPGQWPAPAASLLCLVFGALLAARDTPAVWRAAAVAALAVVTLHVVGGVVFFDPLEGAFGGAYPWAGVTAVLCAGAGAVLAGLALTYRPPRTGAGDTA